MNCAYYLWYQKTNELLLKNICLQAEHFVKENLIEDKSEIITKMPLVRSQTQKLLCQARFKILGKFIYVICLMARWRTGCLEGCLIINLGNICYDLWVMGKVIERKYKKRQVE